MLLPFHHHPLFFSRTNDSVFSPSSSSLTFSKVFRCQNSSSLKPLIRKSSSSREAEAVSKKAIHRIAEKLRSLGYIEELKKDESLVTGHGSAGEIFIPSPHELPKRRVGHTIDSSWSTPENPVPNPGSGSAITRFHELKKEAEKEKYLDRKEKGRVPTLAELTITSRELKRLRTVGIRLQNRLKVGKAGVTEGIVNGIHERWRRSELVKIKCEDLCRLNMMRTHEILERKTGGVVVWRSGSIIILYRGANYEYPYFLVDDGIKKHNNIHEKESLGSIEDNSNGEQKDGILCSTDGKEFPMTNSCNNLSYPSLVHGVVTPSQVRFQLPGEALLEDEADKLLDDLGPRFSDWWGYDPLPVDADLLPPMILGFRKPFRLLPFGMQPKLTDREMTILRRLSRHLPCHFALGRNKGLQGLAVSMFKLWEKCEIAKIAIKRGVQNTNGEMMAEELRRLTGGTLLSRDKEFIVFYRGKDFLPPAVSNAIEDRRNSERYVERPRESQDSSVDDTSDSQRRQDESLSISNLPEVKDPKINHGSETERLKTTIFAKSMQEKLTLAIEKKEKAEKLLEELEKATQPMETEVDKEAISEEERYMLRRVGLRMKPFLLLGRRGIFDGTVENMHLHWKYRELVKIISKEKRIEDVQRAAKILEAESGGVLVAVERVNKGHAIIVYRGKNYQRPAGLRPRTLLNKKQALKRSLEAQRRDSLKLHVLKLTRCIDEMKENLVNEKTPSGSVQETISGEQMGSDITMNATCNSLYSSPNQDNVEEHVLESREHEDPYEIRHSTENDEGGISDLVPFHQSNSQTNLCAHPSLGDVHLTEMELEVSSTELGGEISEASSLDVESVKGSDLKPQVRKLLLSNKQRLLLRKQALKMRKRPVLAVGRNNIVTGVAKAIKDHFKRYPLAIVNIKGRAEGTSVQEVIFKLEQATGAVLVSREPNKVILYRGWSDGEENDGKKKRKIDERKGSSDAQTTISPELIAAIKLECGSQSTQENDASSL